MARPRARKSPTNEDAGGRTLAKSVARPRVWALVLLVCVVACASPASRRIWEVNERPAEARA